MRPATVCRELGLIQHAFDLARREWGIPISENPVSRVSKPAIRNRKNRRIKPAELECLFNACRQCRNPRIEPLLTLALETGMRRSELVNVRQEHIDLDARTIPLSTAALAVLEPLESEPDGRIFPLTTNGVRLAWEDLRRRAGVEDVRFHDLRHEAVSRLFEKGLSVPEVAMTSGHRDLRILQR